MTGERAPEDIELGENRLDKVTAVARAAAGVVPFAGSAISELIDVIVPNLRLDHIEEYARALNRKVSSFSEEQQRTIKTQNEFIDLFESGAFQASRTYSADRREHIIEVVAKGLSSSAAEAINQKRTLTILSDLSDDELIMLQSYALINSTKYGEFTEKHPSLFSDIFASPMSPPHVQETASIREYIRTKLLGMSLIREDTSFDHVKSRTVGKLTTPSNKIYDITVLGRSILKSAGLQTC